MMSRFWLLTFLLISCCGCRGLTQGSLHAVDRRVISVFVIDPSFVLLLEDRDQRLVSTRIAHITTNTYGELITDAGRLYPPATVPQGMVPLVRENGEVFAYSDDELVSIGYICIVSKSDHQSFVSGNISDDELRRTRLRPAENDSLLLVQIKLYARKSGTGPEP